MVGGWVGEMLALMFGASLLARPLSQRLLENTSSCRSAVRLLAAPAATALCVTEACYSLELEENSRWGTTAEG